MNHVETMRGTVSVDSLIREKEMEQSVACAMKIQSDSETMEKVSQAIYDGLDVSKDEDDKYLGEGASIQEINWYVETLQEAVSSVCDEEECENRILALML